MLKSTSRDFCFIIQQMIEQIWCEAIDLFSIEQGRAYNTASQEDYNLLNKSYMDVKDTLEECINLILNKEFSEISLSQVNEIEVIESPNHEILMAKKFYRKFLIDKMISLDLTFSNVVKILDAPPEIVRGIIRGSIREVSLDDLKMYCDKLI